MDVSSKAIEILRRARVGGNIFANYDTGSYFLCRMYAEYKVYIDGARWDGVSREAGFVRHLQIGNDLNALKEEIRKYDIRAFAIPLLPAQDGIVLPHYYLSSDPEWRLAYVDDASILFVSRDEAQDKEAQSTAL